MAQRSPAAEGVLTLSEKDIAKMLASRNPKAPQADIMNASRVFLAAMAPVLNAPPKRRRALAKDASFMKALAEAAAALATPEDKGARSEAEALIGSGLGKRIDAAEGQRRLDAFASIRKLEDWAGPVAGPTELQDKIGISRSTLHAWQRSGAVIGLLKGVRKHVFPLDQFVDGRPLEGLSQVVEIVGDPRDTWLWLIEPLKGKAGSMLSRLKRGEVDAVLEAAAEDFG